MFLLLDIPKDFVHVFVHVLLKTQLYKRCRGSQLSVKAFFRVKATSIADEGSIFMDHLVSHISDGTLWNFPDCFLMI